MTISRAVFRLFSLVAIGLSVPSGAQNSSARVVLQQALEKQRTVDYVRIESRPGTQGGPEWRLKVQTAARMGIKVRILAPLSQEGVVSIDDAKELRTFFPDEDTVLVQPSPYLLQPNLQWRLKLIDRNYKTKFGGSETIAGQVVREVILVPIRQYVPVRKLYVDVKHDVVLKYVVTQPKGPDTVVFDTKSVVFGRAAATEDFELPSESEDANVHKRRGPVKIATPEASKVSTGFSARLVTNPPYGFKESGAYVFSDSRGSYVGIKLSDGMATLTVYQWNPDKFSSVPLRDIRCRKSDTYGVNYGISVAPGEKMPDSVLENIVESYMLKSE